MSNRPREAGSGGPQLASAASCPRFRSSGLGGSCGVTAMAPSALPGEGKEGPLLSGAGPEKPHAHTRSAAGIAEGGFESTGRKVAESSLGHVVIKCRRRSGLSLSPPVCQALLVQKQDYACGQRLPWAGPGLGLLYSSWHSRLPGLSLRAPPPLVGGRRWWGPVLSRQQGRAVNDRAVAWLWLVP